KARRHGGTEARTILEELAATERSRFGAWQIESYDSLDSTQRRVAERMKDAPRDRCVIVAERQSAGRGRRGARWESPRGGLWFSFSLLTGGSADPMLNLLVALAARDAVAELAGARGVELRLEWPNDLAAAGGKWGGVLCDASAVAPGKTLLLFGVGLNLAIPRGQLPELDQPITSIEAEFGASPFPAAALSRILPEIDLKLAADRDRGRGHSVAEVARAMRTIGRRVCWRDASGARREGFATALGNDGGLHVDVQGGGSIVLTSGEVRQIVDMP
ncbi:MAG: biotin--[acetyl-CoA-carboxylase] ligase, partial [Planctomycetes bacterium]|nr:biotin--[acetyl-CoA-carboxylase] ligase [Planctomycetota bacterium]